MTVKTQQLEIGDDSGVLVAGEWRLNGKGVEMTLVKSADHTGDLGAGDWRLN